MTAEMIPTTREVKMRIPKEMGCPRRMWDEKSTIVAASVCVCRFDAELVAFVRAFANAQGTSATLRCSVLKATTWMV